ncbi:MAG: hypothetical protein AAFZ18_11635 [Myxococcota bacterium]
MTHEEIEKRIELHRETYALVIWLASEAMKRPELLSPEDVRHLRTHEGALAWLGQRRASIPPHLLPKTPPTREWARMFSSFFSASFVVEQLFWDGRVLETDVKTRSAVKPSSRKKELSVLRTQALRVLMRDRGLKLSADEAQRCARSEKIRKDLDLWHEW